MLTEKGEKNATFHELKTIATGVRAEGEIIDVASGQMGKRTKPISFLEGALASNLSYFSFPLF